MDPITGYKAGPEVVMSAIRGMVDPTVSAPIPGAGDTRFSFAKLVNGTAYPAVKDDAPGVINSSRGVWLWFTERGQGTDIYRCGYVAGGAVDQSAPLGPSTYPGSNLDAALNAGCSAPLTGSIPQIDVSRSWGLTFFTELALPYNTNSGDEQITLSPDPETEGLGSTNGCYGVASLTAGTISTTNATLSGAFTAAALHSVKGVSQVPGQGAFPEPLLLQTAVASHDTVSQSDQQLGVAMLMLSDFPDHYGPSTDFNRAIVNGERLVPSLSFNAFQSGPTVMNFTFIPNSVVSNLWMNGNATQTWISPWDCQLLNNSTPISQVFNASNGVPTISPLNDLIIGYSGLFGINYANAGPPSSTFTQPFLHRLLARHVFASISSAGNIAYKVYFEVFDQHYNFSMGYQSGGPNNNLVMRYTRELSPYKFRDSIDAAGFYLGTHVKNLFYQFPTSLAGAPGGGVTGGSIFHINTDIQLTSRLENEPGVNGPVRVILHKGISGGTRLKFSSSIIVAATPSRSLAAYTQGSVAGAPRVDGDLLRRIVTQLRLGGALRGVCTMPELHAMVEMFRNMDAQKFAQLIQADSTGNLAQAMAAGGWFGDLLHGITSVANTVGNVVGAVVPIAKALAGGDQYGGSWTPSAQAAGPSWAPSAQAAGGGYCNGQSFHLPSSHVGYTIGPSRTNAAQ